MGPELIIGFNELTRHSESTVIVYSKPDHFMTTWGSYCQQRLRMPVGFTVYSIATVYSVATVFSDAGQTRLYTDSK